MPKALEQLRQLLILLLTLALAYASALFVWSLQAAFSAPALPAGPVISLEQAETEPSVSMPELLKHPLFGEKTVEEKASAPPPSDVVQETKLAIRLLGVAAGNDGRGAAVLQHDGKIRSYAVGDTLDTGRDITLAAVWTDHVIIERNGLREKIALPVNQAVGRGTQRTSAQATAAASSNASQTIDLRSAAVQREVGDIRQVIKQQPLSLIRYINLAPQRAGNRQIGYRLSPGPNGALFRQLGLVAGDVVTHINGQDVTRLNVPQLNQMLANNEQFNLQLMRRGRTISVDVSL